MACSIKEALIIGCFSRAANTAVAMNGKYVSLKPSRSSNAAFTLVHAHHHPCHIDLVCGMNVRTHLVTFNHAPSNNRSHAGKRNNFASQIVYSGSAAPQPYVPHGEERRSSKFAHSCQCGEIGYEIVFVRNTASQRRRPARHERFFISRYNLWCVCAVWGASSCCEVIAFRCGPFQSATPSLSTATTALTCDHIPFCTSNLGEHTRSRRRNFRIHLISRDFEEGLVLFNPFACFFQPSGDCPFHNRFAHLRHQHIQPSIQKFCVAGNILRAGNCWRRLHHLRIVGLLLCGEFCATAEPR